MQLEQAIQQRRSTRAFLSKDVPQETVEAVLDLARHSPSGVNMQPWRIAVVSGETKERLGQTLIAARKAGKMENPDYHYYPQEWFEPYKSRRKETGLALYSALGIAKEDIERRVEAWNNNYRFFDAPIGLLVFLDRRLGHGSWIDIGMFMQNILLSAEAHGLATCPQASLAEFPDTVRELLGIEHNWALACGIALGYPDTEAAVNTFRTPREPVESFTSWHG